MSLPRLPLAGLSCALALLATAALAAPAPPPLEEGDVVEVLPGGSETIDTAAALELVLEHDPSVRDERAYLGVLQGQTVQARSGGLPRFEAHLNWSRARDPSFALDETFSSGGDSGPGLGDLLQPLYDQHPGLSLPELPPFGFVLEPEDIPAQSFWRSYVEGRWELHPTRLRNAVQAANIALDGQRARVEDARHRAAEAALTTYQQVLLAEAQRRAVEVEVVAREEFLATTRRRFELGSATPLDTLQAAVRVANLRPQLRRAALDLRQAGQRLNIAMGRAPQAPLSVVAEFPLEPGTLPLAEALERLDRRPDLRAQESLVGLYGEQRASLRADGHPYLSVEGSYGYVAKEVGGLFEEGLDSWRVAAGISWPFWDGQYTRGRVREAEGNLHQQRVRLHDARRQARAELLAAHDAVQVARDDLAAARLNLQQASQAADEVAHRYELGKAGQLDVLDAQAERFRARSLLVEARYQLIAATATYRRASGLAPGVAGGEEP